MDEQSHNQEYKELALENQRLLKENNLLLKKIHRSSVRHMWLSILWLLLILGVPVLLFYKFVLPLLNSVEQLPQSVGTQLIELGEQLQQSR